MIIIPAFLSRTVAGIPEKESVAFFFMFLSFYLFLKAWKSERIICRLTKKN
jgi:asparagine N-glycosylation enzyme membrane subunit Stt3